MEYPESCSTTIRCVVRKMGLYDLEIILPWECNFWMGGLAYDNCVELKTFANHFFAKFPNSIEKNDWSIWLGRIKRSLVRLGNDNCCRSFEMSWPMSQLYAGISNVDELANIIFISDNWLDIAPRKFVWAWCQWIVAFFNCIDNFVLGKRLPLNCRFIWNFI